MTIEHHDLVHELPEFREAIHELKMKDAHFQRLFDEYHETTRQVARMEAEIEPVMTQVEEEYKLKRLHLKDELYAMLRAHRG
ncbi:YdcH family protein [Marinobacterium rhizophilum]|uniref:YdcH family protein n=1 Tax=Marinobacterium rhizophilum TaxID=420402 RepID=UPI00035F71D0|nr:YdcH family protein [Marinobacterium rhizophilum]